MFNKYLFFLCFQASILIVNCCSAQGNMEILRLNLFGPANLASGFMFGNVVNYDAANWLGEANDMQKYITKQLKQQAEEKKSLEINTETVMEIISDSKKLLQKDENLEKDKRTTQLEEKIEKLYEKLNQIYISCAEKIQIEMEIELLEERLKELKIITPDNTEKLVALEKKLIALKEKLKHSNKQLTFDQSISRSSNTKSASVPGIKVFGGGSSSDSEDSKKEKQAGNNANEETKKTEEKEEPTEKSKEEPKEEAKETKNNVVEDKPSNQKEYASQRQFAIIAGLMLDQMEWDTPLLRAVSKENNLAEVEDLVKNGADPYAQDKGGWSPIMIAAHTRQVGYLRAMLSAHKDPFPLRINAVNGLGFNALMLAMRHVNVKKDMSDIREIIKILVANGAYIDIATGKNKQGPDSLKRGLGWGYHACNVFREYGKFGGDMMLVYMLGALNRFAHLVDKHVAKGGHFYDLIECLEIFEFQKVDEEDAVVLRELIDKLSRKYLIENSDAIKLNLDLAAQAPIPEILDRLIKIAMKTKDKGLIDICFKHIDVPDYTDSINDGTNDAFVAELKAEISRRLKHK
jgi:ankyrin repeat protein